MNTTGSLPSRRPVRRTWLWLAFTLVLAAPNAGRPQNEPKNQVQTILQELRDLLSKGIKDRSLSSGNTIVVAIGSGHLTYVYPSTSFKAGGDINWVSMDGPFTITPLGKSPFEQAPIYSKPGTTTSGNTIHIATGKIAATAPKASYPYVIALYYNGQNYVDVNCPPIIVE